MAASGFIFADPGYDTVFVTVGGLDERLVRSHRPTGGKPDAI
jgi:hypothetical protein